MKKAGWKNVAGFILTVIVTVCLLILFLFFQEERQARRREQEKATERAEKSGGVAEQIDLTQPGALTDSGRPGEIGSPAELFLEGGEFFRLWNVTYYSYDEQGNFTGTDRYDSEGKLYEYKHYTYDERGNRIREQSETPGVGWETYRETVCTYDDQNRLIQEEDYDAGKLSCEYYLRYQPDGTTYTVSQYYDSDGAMGSYYTATFNENGDPVTEYDYDKDGGVTRCWKYRYDEEGRQVYAIFYPNGDETTTALREVYTEYEEDRTVRYSYEPLGHLNSVHYVVAEGDLAMEMYYLAGYSGTAGIHILGQEEPKWNQGLKFWEGSWRAYNGDDKLSVLNCLYDRIKTYCAYWYVDGKAEWELECGTDGSITTITLKQNLYDAEGRTAESRKYGMSLPGERLAATLQDGTGILLEFDVSAGYRQLIRLLQTDAEGGILREITFDAENCGRLVDWYEPLREQKWAEELMPTEEGIVAVGGGEVLFAGGNGTGGQTGDSGSESGEAAGGHGGLLGGGDGQGGASGDGPDEGSGSQTGGSGEATTPPGYYTVQKNDSLWRIAERFYGDPYQFVKIYRENRTVIGPDWNFIPEGMILYLPE